jgi:hypothetical protein
MTEGGHRDLPDWQAQKHAYQHYPKKKLLNSDCPMLDLKIGVIFYNRMTVHRDRFLVNKTNRCTEFQFYWYYYSTCFGQTFCPSSAVLSSTWALVKFMQLWPYATRSRMGLHLTPGSKRSSQLYKMYQSWCTAKNSWWWTERLPETCRVVIPMKLEFSASVGFIHNEMSYSQNYYSSYGC